MLHRDVENNLYKLALRVGSNATIKEFHIAKSVIFELSVQLIQATTTVKESITALFTTMYEKALSNNEQPKAADVKFNTVSPNFIFYNWLDEREGYNAPNHVQMNTSFFYNWLDEREY